MNKFEYFDYDFINMYRLELEFSILLRDVNHTTSKSYSIRYYYYFTSDSSIEPHANVICEVFNILYLEYIYYYRFHIFHRYQQYFRCVYTRGYLFIHKYKIYIRRFFRVHSGVWYRYIEYLQIEYIYYPKKYE